MAGKVNRAYEADEQISIELQKPDAGVLTEAGKTHAAELKELHPTVSSPKPETRAAWGWMIVAASLYLYTFTESAYGYGVFFVPFEDYFGSSNAETAWLVSAQFGTMCIVGPLASVCVNRFGCRASVMFGSAFTAVSTFCSTFSPNIAVLILFQVLNGFGHGFVHIAAVVSVGHYIERRRGLAAGIVSSGGGIAAFVFPPFFNFLLTQYGWKGAFWIQSGVVLNGLVCGFAYRRFTKSPATGRQDEREDKQDKQTDKRTDIWDEVTDEKDEQTDKKDERTDKHHNRTNKRDERTEKQDERTHKRTDKKDKRTDKQDEVTDKQDKLTDKKDERTDKQDKLTDKKDERTDKQDKRTDKKGEKTDKQDKLTDKKDERTDKHDKLTDKKDEQTDKQDKLTDKKDEHTDTENGVKNVDVNETDAEKRQDNNVESFCDSLRKYFDLSVLRSPVFLAYWFSVALTSVGVLVPSSFLPPLANDLDIDSTSAAFLVSIIGIANIASRIASGFLADLSCCDPLVINGAALVIGGLATSLVPFLETYPLLAAYSAVFGSCVGTFTTLRTPILIELLGLVKFTNSFGVLMVAHALGVYAGPSLAGLISDLTSDYSLAFQVTGAIIGLSGVICFPLCCHIRRSRTSTIEEIQVE